MKITVQLVVCDDDDHKETLTDVVVLEKACQRIEEVGLTLAEAKALLSALQQQIVERQAATFLAMCRHCQACGTPVVRNYSISLPSAGEQADWARRHGWRNHTGRWRFQGGEYPGTTTFCLWGIC
jgi:hypothetical protein